MREENQTILNCGKKEKDSTKKEMNHRFIVEIFGEVAGLGQKGRTVINVINVLLLTFISTLLFEDIT